NAAYACLFGGQVDIHLLNALHLAQGSLDPADTRCAAHAFYGKFNGIGRNVETDLLYCLHERVETGSRSRLHVGTLSGQINGNLLYARHFSDSGFHAPDTGRACHAFDGKGNVNAVGGWGTRPGRHARLPVSVTDNRQHKPSHDGKVKRAKKTRQHRSKCCDTCRVCAGACDSPLDQMARSARSSAIADSDQPSSCRMASVCSPRAGIGSMRAVKLLCDPGGSKAGTGPSGVATSVQRWRA